MRDTTRPWGSSPGSHLPPKFCPVEEQALNNKTHYPSEHLQEFACLHLLEESPCEHKFMMLITPLPNERYASLDIDTKAKLSIDKVKAFLANTSPTPLPKPTQPPDWTPPSTPRPQPEPKRPRPTTPPTTPPPYPYPRPPPAADGIYQKNKSRLTVHGFFSKTSSPESAVADAMARTRSSAESYNRLHTKDGTLKRFTQDLEPVSNEPYKLAPINILGDNKSVTFTAKNPLTSVKSRWMDVRWFRLREFVKEGFVRISHIYTQQNVADFFTKPLQKDNFLRLRRFLMNN